MGDRRIGRGGHGARRLAGSLCPFAISPAPSCRIPPFSPANHAGAPSPARGRPLSSRSSPSSPCSCCSAACSRSAASSSSAGQSWCAGPARARSSSSARWLAHPESPAPAAVAMGVSVRLHRPEVRRSEASRARQLTTSASRSPHRTGLPTEASNGPTSDASRCRICVPRNLARAVECFGIQVRSLLACGATLPSRAGALATFRSSTTRRAARPGSTSRREGPGRRHPAGRSR